MDTFKQDESVGFTFSSKNILKNIETAYTSAEKGDFVLNCSIDGTYRFHIGGWVLTPVGCIGVVYDRGVFVQRFFPFCFAFVKVEDTFGSTKIIESLVATAKRKFGIGHFEAKYANIDHSAALFNGLVANWPDIIIQTCWPHLARKLIEKRKFLVENTDGRMK